MKEAAREFLHKLASEEERLIERLTLDDVGLGLLTAIKEFDFYYYNFIRNERTEETDLHMHLMQLGLPRLIAGVLTAVPVFRYPVLTFQSDDTLILGALKMVAAYGFIEQGRRFGQSALAGDCDIRRVSDGLYEVVMPDTVYNMEQHEAHVEQHYTRLHREKVDAMVQETFGGVMDDINRLLYENVFVFEKRYIGYDAHPDLDDFFFGLASMEIQNQPGWDTFNWRLKFGDVPMQKYTLAATYFLSLALKHEKFAEALIEKAPEIRLRDVLTITRPRQLFEDLLIEALDRYGPAYEGYTPLTRDEARTILKVLSVSRRDLDILSSTMSPLPFLIEFSDTAWVTSIASVQIGAIEFLLNSLRHHFSADYDRNQQTREGSMQKALRRFLNEYLPGLHMVDNVAIRQDGKVLTDIDFAAVDEAEGTVILFQLKHQDHYGGDIRRRSNRSGRLRKEVAHWLEATRTWIAAQPVSIGPALRLKNSVQCKRIYLVVVARHFAHFLSTMDLRDDAAYATWVQLFDALNRLRSDGGPQTLNALAGLLQRFMSHKMATGFTYDLVDNYHLRDLTYRVRPAAAAQANTASSGAAEGGP
jgi:hypothetical protein